MGKITDIWFRCELDLEDLATQLGLRNIDFDRENYWEWVTGYVGNHHLDITRLHSVEPDSTDTRIFLLGSETRFGQQLINKIVDHLKRIEIKPIYLGTWTHIGGEDYDKNAVETNF